MTIESNIYQGQFGNFTITDSDRQEVTIYRLGLAIAGVSFFVGILLFLWLDLTTIIEQILTGLFALFILGLGVSLQKIHIYLKPLHNTLKVFWLIGTISTIIFSINSQGNLINFIKNQPLSLFGIGFIFASLTGIFIKEAFCFNSIESKILSVIIPSLLLGYIIGIFPLPLEQILLTIWGILFLVFIMRKATQEIPPDIGDKSVFEYLRNQKNIL
ncbi:MAG: DUF2301 domain-containing membrane protein [Cyanobacteria bacterium]|nr:DUF2301 domain-containing membrane protein [Cyanobacteria bacterium CG_2015-16_32_12]NCO77422.1 DUF2301 domain-containing membrane protein [Cyanobacteria bacterium CG_2015-22_32_23]NCQ04230.1 DUF2301 domain-containing membrane protein [Cyanobacteria bacterium CG_2015-09_32_10]NCQ42279.1 DUF2301 domain-containing membrane protein [Cyanobacteria bacterium CG_2015-04_32_10]NCS84769.1 DUF2301 domain-containing membrane protein [Cyanobacteria bacterium CG_2015-02_32_10]